MNRMRILKVDLEKETTAIEFVGEDIARSYIGGSGIAARTVWRDTGLSTDPLSGQNPLLFMIGPLTGRVPMSSRYSVASLSPATGGWGEAHAGGSWPVELAQTGLSGIVFQGRAKRPVYLYLVNDSAEIRGAAHLWGKDSYESCALLQQETDRRAKVATIGAAGENLVNLAAIMSEGKIGRAAARGGLGAVMGAKNLKAVVVLGTQRPYIHDEPSLKESNRQTVKALSEIRKRRANDWYQCGEGLANWQASGNLAVRNFSRGRFDSFTEKMKAVEPIKYYPCKLCPVGCSQSTLGEKGRGIVGEALVPMGSLCLVDDAEAILEAWDSCQRLGMDAISVGACIAFGMELFEKGMITASDTGGVDLSWGNGAALVEMVRQIGQHRGLGKVLGQGTKKAAESIGGKAIDYAMQVKGLELARHEPRSLNSLFLAYATSNRGACHLEAHSHALERGSSGEPWGPDGTEIGHSPASLARLGFEGKADLVIKMQHLQALFNSLAMCNFAFGWYGVRPSTFVKWLNDATGWDMTLEEFMTAGERIFNLKRLINLRRGFTAKDDRLPQRILERRPDLDPAVEAVPDSQEQLLQEYYSLRGWDSHGIPTRDKLEELGLPPTI